MPSFALNESSRAAPPPTRSDPITLAWAVTAYAFNVVAETNYGYLNEKPSSASLLDLLGPWPWYVLAEIGIILVFWAGVMTWPWTRSRSRSRVAVSAPS